MDATTTDAGTLADARCRKEARTLADAGTLAGATQRKEAGGGRTQHKDAQSRADAGGGRQSGRNARAAEEKISRPLLTLVSPAAWPPFTRFALPRDRRSPEWPTSEFPHPFSQPAGYRGSLHCFTCMLYEKRENYSLTFAQLPIDLYYCWSITVASMVYQHVNFFEIYHFRK